MNYPIKKLSLVLAAFVMAVSWAVAFLAAANQTSAAKDSAQTQFDKIIQRAAKSRVEDMLRVCQIMQRLNAADYEAAATAIKTELSSMGAATTGVKYIWANKYQQNAPSDFQHAEIPVITFGQTSISPERPVSKEVKRPALQNSAAIAGIMNDTKIDCHCDISILVKATDSGELLRLATTLKHNGEPMIGSTLDDTAKTSNITRTLLAHKTYYGTQKIGSMAYLAVYEPIFDQYGDVVGALEFLKGFADISYLFDMFENIRIGEEGTLWGLQLNGASAPTLVFMRETKTGEYPPDDVRNLRELKSDFPEIVETAVETGDGKISFRKISPDNENTTHTDVFAAFSYFKPWNMVLGITVHSDNFSAGAEAVSAAVDKSLLMLLCAAALLFAAGMAFAHAAVRAAGENISAIAQSAAALRNADEKSARRTFAATAKFPVEISEIAAIKSAVVSAIKSTAMRNSELGKTAENTRVAAAEMSEKAEQVGKNTESEIGKLADLQSALASIEKTAEILNEAAENTVSGLDMSIAQMKGGSSLLAKLEDNARMLIADSQNVEFQLSDIKERADKIYAVVNTIKLVGERVNMLAVNAAMETERASNASAGFKSIAAEIGKLADSVSISAAQISDMADTMCKSVNSGVLEMKEFSLVMHSCRDSIRNVRETISAAQSTTLEIAPKFEELSRGIRAHAKNVSEIDSGIGTLARRSAETRSDIAELKRNAKNLTATAEAIKLKLENASNAD